MTYDEEKKVAEIIEGLSGRIESLQRENEELREKTALHSADAKTAWAECDELRLKETGLKIAITQRDAYLSRAEAAEAEVKRLKEIIGKVAPAERSKSWLPIKDWGDCRTALASTGGEHNAE